jgi:uncharacterized protein involved in outer membrane biogenesis
MRKLAIVAVVLVAIVVVVMLALLHLIDVNQYRWQIQAQLQQRLNRPVQLGEMQLGVFPLRVEVKNVVIGDDPSYHGNLPFAQVSELDVSVALLPLLSKSIQVDSLELKQAKIEIIRSAQGLWNFSTAGNAPPPMQQAPPAPPQAPAKSAAPPAAPPTSEGFSLAELKVTDSQIAITDYLKHQSRAVYDRVDVTLRDYSSGKPFTLDATVHLPGSGSQTLQLTGDGGPVNNADFASTPFKGKIKLKEVSISGLQTFLNVAALQGTEAVISGSADLSNAGGKMAVSGSLKLDSAVIRGVAVGYPISADFDLTGDLTNDLLQIKQGALKLGSTPLSINGTINTRPNPSVVDVNLSASNASIQEVARLAAFGVAFSPNTRIAGELTANVHAQGPTDHLALNGSVNGRNLEVTGSDIPQPVKVPAIDLAMTPQQIQSNNFTASSGGTTLAVQMTLSEYAGNSPRVDATIKTVNGKVEELLGIAKAYGVSAAEGISGSGNISLDVRATGPIKNTDAMNFRGTGALQNASLKMPSLTQPLHVRSINMQFTQNSVNLTNLAASLGSTNASGNLSIASFQSPRLTFALTADKINVTELEQITGSSEQKGPAKKKAGASWSLIPSANASPAPAAQPSLLQSATGAGSIAVGSILYQQTELTNVHANVQLDHGMIHLNPLTSQIYGGQESSSFTVDTRPNPMTYAINAKLTGVDANKLLSSISTVKDTVYGTLSATPNVTFATPPSGDIVQTLNGTLGLNLANGKITKLDLVKELSKIGKFTGAAGTAAKATPPSRR